jgi:hypothetical protein
MLSHGQHNWSRQPLISVFRAGASTISFKQLLNDPNENEWAPVQIQYFSTNLVVPGIELGTSGSAARNCDQQTSEAVETTSHGFLVCDCIKTRRLSADEVSDAAVAVERDAV